MAAKSRAEKIPWFRRWPVKATTLLALVALLLGGVILAGHWARERLEGQDRYFVEFGEIDCQPPAGMERRDFLDEVLFESRLPRRLNLLDETMPQQLREGFAKHRWVEKVDAIEIKPPRHIVVKLTYRR